ncbi:MAG: DUF1549 domain-containing protein, partial [Planctomycetaceae bacterium]|nr:DUF1549 domain-containing protein [Planctomycetaceae bacterium]
MLLVCLSKRCFPALFLTLLCCALNQVQAQTPEKVSPAKIRSILSENCFQCHGPDAKKRAADLRFDTREGAFANLDGHKAIVPGNVKQSELITRITTTDADLKMPPEESGKKLTAEEIALLNRWIQEGAEWQDHWSFVTPKKAPAPAVKQTNWVLNPIDQFILSRLEKEGLKPSPEADRRTLIRRVTFDLTGLPPKPADVESFVNDKSPNAYERVIDRLLESPQYGEHMARYWLDVARYGDTHGLHLDNFREMWPYRDWVIKAFNSNMHYDQFVIEQLAGDLLPNATMDQQIATGFNRCHVTTNEGGSIAEEVYVRNVIDRVETTGQAFMGLTLGCAVCHDHKFDPMLATDYYGLYGIFESTLYPTMGASNEPSPTQLVAAENNPDSQQKIDEYWDLLSHYQHQIRNHFRPWLKPTLDEYKQVAAQIKQAKKEGHSIEKLEARRQKLLASHKGKFRELMEHGLPWLKQEKARLVKQPPAEMLYAVIDGKPHHAKLHRRGNPSNPGDVVPRQFISVISKTKPDLGQKRSGREELANWITAADHPLTARVMVNRLWYHHFGQGLVKTVDNFGVLGAAPSHPELLDYLANQLIEQQWSLKALHRQMMLSRVYRLDSNDIKENSQRDPENVYLWKYSRRRLDAESIRDAMLLVSGELDREPGGPHPFIPWHKKGYSLNGPFHEVYPSNKRSVYLMTQRLFKHPFLGLFNGPDTNETTGTRTSSNLPTQALYLMNSPFLPELADAFGARILQSAPTEEKQIQAAFQLAFSRNPTPEE